MRKPIAAMVMAAALVAAAPASAQRQSLADRVSALELRTSENQVSVELLNEVAQLRREVQGLRAQVEELEQRNRQLDEAVRAQYMDVDGRLERLEGGGAAAAPGAETDNAAAPPDAVADTDVAALPPPPPADERAAYDEAFGALRAGQYDQSARLFQQFLRSYPDGQYAANAQYWLGESYYVTENYELAQEQFQALVDNRPGHDKTPGALLKVGLSQFGRQQLDAAEATLESVMSRYPGSDAARTAEDRLRTIRIGRLR